MNALTVTGRLADQPVRRDTPNGVVCEFRVAVDGRPRLYLAVQAWGHLAGRCAQHLTSGRQVGVTGQLRHEQWITRSGERAERWFARASEITFLDRPTDPVNDTSVATIGTGQ